MLVTLSAFAYWLHFSLTSCSVLDMFVISNSNVGEIPARICCFHPWNHSLKFSIDVKLKSSLLKGAEPCSFSARFTVRRCKYFIR
ncbi:BFH_collapsed_G0021200.mRNA.1.CDS.1 [Saccharomyces cerevisiae]|nr:BFH_collapsed_G0021200.mRNA.1.CDS.1 [Saccharomyces cerevisiae]